MDILVCSAYISGMCARLLTILAILAITVFTTIGAAHAAGMGGMQADHAAHAGAIVHASSDGHPSCDGGRHCGSADPEMCASVCAGLSVFLTIPGVEAGHAFGPADHGYPAATSHVGRAPGLNERPPKLRLL